jgi:hypothetical protein
VQSPLANPNEQLLRELSSRVNGLENELLGFKNDFSRWAKDVQDGLNSKTDLETVRALE